MIIESKTHQNAEVKFGNNQRVKFNKLCQAEVSNELGAIILEKHPGDFWEKGKKLAPIAVERKPNPDPIENTKELESKLLIASQKAESFERDLKIANEGILSWKVEFEKATAKVEDLTKQVVELSKPKEEGEETGKTDVVDKHVLLEKDIQIIIDLMAKKPDDLKEICKGLELPEADYIELTKNKLVLLIGSKTLINANA